MTEQHSAEPEVWAVVERLCKNGIDTLNCLLELRARVEALEASDTNRSDHIGEANKMVSDGSLNEQALEALMTADGPDHPTPMLHLRLDAASIIRRALEQHAEAIAAAVAQEREEICERLEYLGWHSAVQDIRASRCPQAAELNAHD